MVIIEVCAAIVLAYVSASTLYAILVHDFIPCLLAVPFNLAQTVQVACQAVARLSSGVLLGARSSSDTSLVVLRSEKDPSFGEMPMHA
jgi:hypothetical protein